MKAAHILVIGGGIGGLTAAIALLQRGNAVDIIERDSTFQLYGVGIIQQANVVRAVGALGILDAYLGAGYGFDHVDVFAPDGTHLAKMNTPRLLPGYPANVGISRRALHEVLAAKTVEAGGRIRFGTSAPGLDDDGSQVHVTFSDGKRASYDVVVAADGLNSATRDMLFPDAPKPEFTGQGVWRYGFPRPPDLTGIQSYHGKVGVGLVPLAESFMYLFATTDETGRPHYPRDGLARSFQNKLAQCPPAIRAYIPAITDDAAVVYRPLEWVFLTGPWHRGRVVLLGDAVHATTPHLGQGAGLAIEDSLVLAEELAGAATPEQAFVAYRRRRFDRVRFIVETSKAIGDSQLGTGPHVDQVRALSEMFDMISPPL